MEHKVVKTAMFVKQGKEIPKIGDKVNMTLEIGFSCKVMVLSIEEIEWTNGLILKVYYRVKVLEVTEDKQQRKNEFRIIK